MVNPGSEVDEILVEVGEGHYDIAISSPFFLAVSRVCCGKGSRNRGRKDVIYVTRNRRDRKAFCLQLVRERVVEV